MACQPKLLDLFCGAGGACYGYQQAGFRVTGVDIEPQPLYPGERFIQDDALTYLARHGAAYDVIHASPPCQAYSALKHLTRRKHPMLIEDVRDALTRTGKPWVIENVIGAPLRWPLILCGTMFGLQTPCGAQLRRHRLFESPLLLMAPGHCAHGERTLTVNGHEFRDEATRWAERRLIKAGLIAALTTQHTITVTGTVPQQNVVRNRIRTTFSVADARIAMGIDWMPMHALSQAIPPAYTQWIGTQLLRAMEKDHGLPTP